MAIDHQPDVNRGKFGFSSFNTPAAFSDIQLMPNRDFVLPDLTKDPEPFIPAVDPRPPRPNPEVDNPVAPPKNDCPARTTKRER